MEQYPKDAFPTERVYGDIDHAGLRLITCGGAFDRAARSYRDNVVVYAGLVGRLDRHRGPETRIGSCPRFVDQGTIPNRPRR